MRRWTLVLVSLGSAAAAQAPGAAPVDQQGYIAYHECMMLAAMAASRTDAPDGAIFALAKARCAGTRAAVAAGRNAALLAALDQADAETAADFPEWIHGARARHEAWAIPAQ